jgi:MOSC domain-containing protein YiiM
MFGVPPGPIWDPADTTGEVIDGVVVAPLDIAAWPPRPATEIPGGTVEAIVIAPQPAGPVMRVEHADALPGRGLAGDRYADGTGTFASGRPGSALTLVDADVLDKLGSLRGAPVDHRRNVVVRGTDLNALVGRTFRLGEVLCRGRRLCEPCAHLDRLNAGGILRPLVHRGGLRADILTAGTLKTGDRLSLD